MSSATLSTKGQLVIPRQFRRALHLQPGDQVAFELQGSTLLLRRAGLRKARLVQEKGRKVLVAPRGAPPMSPETIKALLVEFP